MALSATTRSPCALDLHSRGNSRQDSQRRIHHRAVWKEFDATVEASLVEASLAVYPEDPLRQQIQCAGQGVDRFDGSRTDAKTGHGPRSNNRFPGIPHQIRGKPCLLGL